LAKAKDAKPRVLASSATFLSHEGPKIAGLPQLPNLEEEKIVLHPKLAGTKACTFCLCIVALLLVSGCAATIDLASAEDDAAAKRFTTPQGESNIYITRKEQFTGSAVLFQVAVDGRMQGGIAPGTYHVVSVAPGLHSVSVTTSENQSMQKVDTLAGENYFFEVKPKMGWIAARAEVVQLTESDGRAAIAANSLAKGLQLDN
jgi:hypothetical protein